MRIRYFGRNNKEAMTNGERCAVITYRRDEAGLAIFVFRVIRSAEYSIEARGISSEALYIDVDSRGHYTKLKELFRIAKENYRDGNTPDILYGWLYDKITSMGLCYYGANRPKIIGIDYRKRKIMFAVQCKFCVGKVEYAAELEQTPINGTRLSIRLASSGEEVSEQEIKEKVVEQFASILSGVISPEELFMIRSQCDLSVYTNNYVWGADFILSISGEKYSCELRLFEGGVKRYVVFDGELAEIHDKFDVAIKAYQKEKLIKQFYSVFDADGYRFVLNGTLDKVDQFCIIEDVYFEFHVCDVPIGTEKCSIRILARSDGEVMMEPIYKGYIGEPIYGDHHNKIKQWLEGQTQEVVAAKAEAKFKELVDMYCALIDNTPEAFYVTENMILLYKGTYETIWIDYMYDGEEVELYTRGTDWHFLTADDEESMETMCHYIHEKSENSERVRAADFILHNMVSDTEGVIWYDTECIEIQCTNGPIIISGMVAKCNGQSVGLDYIDAMISAEDSEEKSSEIKRIANLFGTL